MSIIQRKPTDVHGVNKETMNKAKGSSVVVETDATNTKPWSMASSLQSSDWVSSFDNVDYTKVRDKFSATPSTLSPTSSLINTVNVIDEESSKPMMDTYSLKAGGVSGPSYGSVDLNILGALNPYGDVLESEYYKCFSEPSTRDANVPVPAVTPVSETANMKSDSLLSLSLSESNVSVPSNVPLSLQEALAEAATVPIEIEVPEPPMPITSSTARKSKEQEAKIYVATVKSTDVLLGRGGQSNHHKGNKRYREEVSNLQPWYSKCDKPDKTKVADGLVAFVQGYGGRFLKKDQERKKWYIVPYKIARRKCSQALREHNNAP